MENMWINSGIINNVIEAINAKKKPVYIADTFGVSMGDIASITALKEAIDAGSLDCLDTLRDQKRITGTMYEYGLEKICEGTGKENKVEPKSKKTQSLSTDTIEKAIALISENKLSRPKLSKELGISIASIDRVKFAKRCMDNLDLDRLNDSRGYYLHPGEPIYEYAKAYILKNSAGLGYFRHQIKKAGEMGAAIAERGIIVEKAKELKDSGSTIVEVANTLNIPVDNTVRVFDPYAATSESIKKRLMEAVTYDRFGETRFLVNVLDAMKDFYDKMENKAV